MLADFVVRDVRDEPNCDLGCATELKAVLSDRRHEEWKDGRATICPFIGSLKLSD